MNAPGLCKMFIQKQEQDIHFKREDEAKKAEGLNNDINKIEDKMSSSNNRENEDDWEMESIEQEEEKEGQDYNRGGDNKKSSDRNSEEN